MLYRCLYYYWGSTSKEESTTDCTLPGNTKEAQPAGTDIHGIWPIHSRLEDRKSDERHIWWHGSIILCIAPCRDFKGIL
jgi:hypothetical protein